jgi:hypothetical protein
VAVYQSVIFLSRLTLPQNLRHPFDCPLDIFNRVGIREPQIALSVLFALLGGCRPASANEQVVIVYTSVDQPFSEPILAAFEQRTGIQDLAQPPTMRLLGEPLEGGTLAIDEAHSSSL